MTRRGFTIVEMMIAFVILGLLATVTLQGGRTMTQSAGEQVALEAVRAVVASGQSEAMRYPQATVAVALNGTRAQVLRDGTPVPLRRRPQRSGWCGRSSSPSRRISASRPPTSRRRA